MKRPVLILAFIAVVCAGWLVYSLFTTPRYRMPPLQTGNTAELKQTEFVPALQTPHASGKNLVWCGTFQMAWNKLMDKVGGKVELSGSPPDGARLNDRIFVEGMIDAESAYSGVASTSAELKAMRSELESKFGRDIETQLLPNKMDGGTLVTYSLLMKTLEFENLLQSLKEPIDFKSARVAAFGLGQHSRDFNRLASQIRVHDYAGPDDFVIELITKSHDDQILIAKVPPGATLLDTTKAVLDRRGKADVSSPSSSEPVHIPKLNFDYTTSFSSLAGRTIQNAPHYKGNELAAALQSIRFKLDERGAVLKSEAALIVKSASKYREGDPRTFIVDGPFLILMIRAKAPQPYFAMWVDNAELLVAHE
jgi:hypothetical protein